MTDDALIYDPSRPLDPLGDGERQASEGVKKNYAKVGSARPSSLIYTYGPGAVMDLPHFTVMPSGLDDWDRIYARRDGAAPIHAPALLDVVQMLLGTQVRELRRFPHEPSRTAYSRDGADLGVPARVFPNGCGARAVIGWRRSRRSTTGTPRRSGPTKQPLSTRHATVVGCRPRPPHRLAAMRPGVGKRDANQPSPPATCWPAPTATWTNSLTAGGFTKEVRAPPGLKPPSSA